MLVDYLHVVKCVFGISVFIYGARVYIMLFVIILFIKFLKTNEQTKYIKKNQSYSDATKQVHQARNAVILIMQ